MEIAHVPCLPEAARHLDFSFDIDSALTPPFDGRALATQPVAPRRKAYPIDDSLLAPIAGDGRAIFIAQAADDLAGYISVSEGWNNCADVDDFAVARTSRRQGVAKALMDHAAAWARDRGFPALRLETQSNNIAACHFYRNYGFALGGSDSLLYRWLETDIADEVALFWYLPLLRN